LTLCESTCSNSLSAENSLPFCFKYLVAPGGIPQHTADLQIKEAKGILNSPEINK